MRIPSLQVKQAVTPSNNCATTVPNRTLVWIREVCPSSVHPKMVLFVGTSHFISICLKSMIVSIHNYDICDVNGAPRVVQYTTWATVYNDPTIHPQPSQAICSLDSVPAKPSGTKTERKRVVPEATPHLITDGILWGNRIKVLLETSQQMWLLLPSVHSKHPLLFLIFCCTPNSIRKAANFSPWGSFSTQAINAWKSLLPKEALLQVPLPVLLKVHQDVSSRICPSWKCWAVMVTWPNVCLDSLPP